MTLVVLVELVYTRVLDDEKKGLWIEAVGGVKDVLVETYRKWNAGKELWRRGWDLHGYLVVNCYSIFEVNCRSGIYSSSFFLSWALEYEM